MISTNYLKLMVSHPFEKHLGAFVRRSKRRSGGGVVVDGGESIGERASGGGSRKGEAVGGDERNEKRW